MNTITEVNCETGKVIERELNADEIAQRKIDADNEKANQLAIAEAAKAKAALLAKLGITAEEAALLLG
jgi:ParB-like chromosome segregation protein Spo0J